MNKIYFSLLLFFTDSISFAQADQALKKQSEIDDASIWRN